MNDIFENAYYGKAYKTRDGRKAIYIGNDGTVAFQHRLNIEGNYAAIGWFNEFGVLASNNEDRSDDIVSEWREEINEEELNRLAEEETSKTKVLPYDWKAYRCFEEGFKAGYRKAKEEQQ